jgi:hypothetical protein
MALGSLMMMMVMWRLLIHQIFRKSPVFTSEMACTVFFLIIIADTLFHDILAKDKTKDARMQEVWTSEEWRGDKLGNNIHIKDEPIY